MTAINKFNLTYKDLEDKYMGLYAPAQIMNDPVHGQISYNSSFSNACKMKVGYNLKTFLVEMNTARGKDIVEHIIRPARVMRGSLLTVNDYSQLITILRLQMDQITMNEWCITRQVGLRLLVLLM